MKVEDPVCKMTIEDKDAAGASTYKGATYYFCSVPCKEDFDKEPGAFVTNGERTNPSIPPFRKGGQGGI